MAIVIRPPISRDHLQAFKYKPAEHRRFDKCVPLSDNGHHGEHPHPSKRHPKGPHCYSLRSYASSVD